MARQALIVGWSHPSDTVLSLAASLAAGLRANGIEARIVDLFNPEHHVQLAGFRRNQFAQIYLLGSFALRPRIGGRPIFEHFTGHCLCWLLDPLIYEIRYPATRAFFAAARQSDRLCVMFPDRSYMELAEPLGARRSIYFPYAAAFSPPAALVRQDVEPPRADVLVVANLGEELSDQAGLSAQEIVRAMDPFGLSAARAACLLDRVMNDPDRSNVTAAVCEALALDMKDLWAPPAVAFVAGLDASEKRRRRRAIVQAVRSLNVDIVGLGWREAVIGRSNLRAVGGPVPHQALPALFGRYRVLLDFAPNWDAGFNDRVMASLAAGCRVVTSHNAAVAELGDAAGYVATYSQNRPDPETQLASALSAPPIAPAELATLGTRHDWPVRVRQLLNGDRVEPWRVSA